MYNVSLVGAEKYLACGLKKTAPRSLVSYILSRLISCSLRREIASFHIISILERWSFVLASVAISM